MALTAKQQRFVDEYLVDLNAMQACIRAGYSPIYAQKKSSALVVKCSTTIAERQKKREEETGITAAWVLERLKAEATLTGDGGSASARVAALGLAMRHLGMLKEDAPHPDRPRIDISRLTPEQRASIANGLRLALTG